LESVSLAAKPSLSPAVPRLARNDLVVDAELGQGRQDRDGERHGANGGADEGREDRIGLDLASQQAAPRSSALQIR
jgi:hypothetical protein